MNYSEINSIQQLGRAPKQWNGDLKFLSIHVTKASVYKNEISCEQLGFRCVKLRTFRKLWQELCPNICKMLPASDLCCTCQSVSYRYQAAGNQDLQKQAILDEIRAYREIGNQERLFLSRVSAPNQGAHYRKSCQSADFETIC